MRTALFSLVLVAAACGAPNIVQSNENNGSAGNLSFKTIDTAAGGSSLVTVFYSDKGPYSCHDSVDWVPITGTAGGAPQSCTFVGTVVHLRSLVSATCRGTACTATLDGLGVHVASNAAEAVELDVTALMDDGTTVADSIPVTFIAPETLSLTCDDFGLCPGPHAVFVGARFEWTPGIVGNGAQLAGTVTISIVPDGVIEMNPAGYGVSGDGYTLSPWIVHAVGPGTATVTVTFGGLERVQTVRVVTEADAVAGEVHLANHDAWRNASQWGVDVAVDMLGPVAPAQREPFTSLIVAWTLSDGTLVLGGSDRVSTPTMGVAIETVGTTALGVDGLMFDVYSKGSCASQSVRLTETRGTAQLDDTFTLICP